MADETKAANHIDFTSVPYKGPSLTKGQELLTGLRTEAAKEVTSLQKGWYYSGQLDQMVIWEKGAFGLLSQALADCERGLTLAPSPSSLSSTRIEPRAAAMCSGVWPNLSATSMLNPSLVPPVPSNGCFSPPLEEVDAEYGGVPMPFACNHKRSFRTRKQGLETEPATIESNGRQINGRLRQCTYEQRDELMMAFVRDPVHACVAVLVGGLGVGAVAEQ